MTEGERNPSNETVQGRRGTFQPVDLLGGRRRYTFGRRGVRGHSAPHATTLLDLVQALQERTDSDEKVVALATHLLRTRQIVLKGIFGAAFGEAGDRCERQPRREG